MIAYGASLGLSEAECVKFYEFNNARLWKLPRGARGWASLLAVWRDRAAEFAPASGSPRKKSSGARSSDPTPFDPTKPHAHTGGLPVVN